MMNQRQSVRYTAGMFKIPIQRDIARFCLADRPVDRTREKSTHCQDQHSYATHQ